MQKNHTQTYSTVAVLRKTGLRPLTHLFAGVRQAGMRAESHHPNAPRVPPSPTNRVALVLAHTNPRHSCMSTGTNSEEHASIQAAGRVPTPVAGATKGLHIRGVFRGLLCAYFRGGLPDALPLDHWTLQARWPLFTAHQWEGNEHLSHYCK